MNKVLILVAMFTISTAAHAIRFSNNSPLPQHVKTQMTEVVAQKCYVAGLQVVESRTLVITEEVENGDRLEKYFTTLAVLSLQNEVYSKIELLAEISAELTQVSLISSPLCTK